MGVVQNVPAGIERNLLPENSNSSAPNNQIFQMIDEKLDYKFAGLVDKLDLNKRVTALKEKQKPEVPQ
jgi:hypothetical protein